MIELSASGLKNLYAPRRRGVYNIYIYIYFFFFFFFFFYIRSLAYFCRSSSRNLGQFTNSLLFMFSAAPSALKIWRCVFFHKRCKIHSRYTWTSGKFQVFRWWGASLIVYAYAARAKETREKKQKNKQTRGAPLFPFFIIKLLFAHAQLIFCPPSTIWTPGTGYPSRCLLNFHFFVIIEFVFPYCFALTSNFFLFFKLITLTYGLLFRVKVWPWTY